MQEPIEDNKVTCMVKMVGHILGCIYDLPAKHVLVPVLLKVFKISLDPSPSRWGFFAVFLAWGLFSLSLFYTMPPPPERGDMMWLFWLGIALIVTAVYVGGYFLRHQDRDPSSNQQNRIERGITEINTTLGRTNELLEQLIEMVSKRLDKWDGQ